MDGDVESDNYGCSGPAKSAIRPARRPDQGPGGPHRQSWRSSLNDSMKRVAWDACGSDEEARPQIGRMERGQASLSRLRTPAWARSVDPRGKPTSLRWSPMPDAGKVELIERVRRERGGSKVTTFYSSPDLRSVRHDEHQEYIDLRDTEAGRCVVCLPCADKAGAAASRQRRPLAGGIPAANRHHARL